MSATTINTATPSKEAVINKGESPSVNQVTVAEGTTLAAKPARIVKSHVNHVTYDLDELEDPLKNIEFLKGVEKIMFKSSPLLESRTPIQSFGFFPLSTIDGKEIFTGQQHLPSDIKEALSYRVDPQLEFILNMDQELDLTLPHIKFNLVWLLKHPEVASSYDVIEIEGSRIKCYIVVKEKETKDFLVNATTRLKAMNILVINPNYTKLRTIGSLMNFRGLEKESNEQVAKVLLSALDNDPTLTIKFLEWYDHKDYLIYESVTHAMETGVIAMSGTTKYYLFMDKSLGKSREEIVEFFRVSANRGLLNSLDEALDKLKAKNN